MYHCVYKKYIYKLFIKVYKVKILSRDEIILFFQEKTDIKHIQEVTLYLEHLKKKYTCSNYKSNNHTKSTHKFHKNYTFRII